MYYVYKISLGTKTYIGCTNFLRRRKDQHNENARKRKSKLGRFLSDNNIVLKTEDLKVIAEFDSRADALFNERETAINLAKNGVELLNDVYSVECSRKGKNLYHTSKDYTLVYMKEHSFKKIHCLRRFCEENNLDYKLLQRTVKGNHSYMGRYKVFFQEEWESEKDKEFYLSGEMLLDIDKKIADGRIKTSKTYLVLFPDDSIHTITNIDSFARSMNMNAGNLHASMSNNKRPKGYKILKKISN